MVCVYIGFHYIIKLITSPLLGLIDAIIERFLNPFTNIPLYRYFEVHYAYLLNRLSQNVILYLPPEDQFFVGLFLKVLIPSARENVCFQRQQIRKGLITVEAARDLIPRKDLILAALRRKYHSPVPAPLPLSPDGSSDQSSKV
jgi:hypothetical protein